MKWVEQAFSAADAAVRLELAQAVAAAAPAPLAASFLAQHASPYLLGQFDVLGLRQGGQAALTHEYNNLLAAGANAAGRRMVVSGLAASGVEVLIGIAGTDPDHEVRGQAVVTATWAPDFQPTAGFLQTVREGHARSGALSGMPPYAVISSAQNLLLRAKGGGQHEVAAEAVQFLRELALDPSIPEYDRDKIPAILRNHVPSAEWEAPRAALKAAGAK